MPTAGKRAELDISAGAPCTHHAHTHHALMHRRRTLNPSGAKPQQRLCVMPTAGKRVELDISAGAFSRSFRGCQSPVDLETTFQLMHLLFTTE